MNISYLYLLAPDARGHLRTDGCEAVQHVDTAGEPDGLILANSGITAASVTYTLPTVADLEAVLTNSDKVGTAFTFRVVNLGTSSATAIIAAGTGWTITGSLTMTIPVTTGAMMIARKSAAGAWTLYRVA